MNTSALHKIGYGLYVLTTFDGERHNGSITNSVMQVTNNPKRVAVTVNKENYTYEVAKKTGKMNLCCLGESAPFAVFERFGFQSGRDTDKFAGLTPKFSENGLAYLSENINSFISLECESYVDLDTHGMFICRVTDAEVINDEETMTYSYYQKNVKPRPEAKKTKGYVCKICGFVYEGDPLPADYICPLCKHPAEDFEPIEA